MSTSAHRQHTVKETDPTTAAETVSLGGLTWGFIGVVAFSWTAPLTRIAATGGISPAFLAYGRAVVPGILAIFLLAGTRQRWPARTDWPSIVVVAVTCVAGFPILTSMAARTVPASHIAVVIGLVPLATAVCSVVRTGERPPPKFWIAGAVGSAAVVAFVGVDEGAFGRFTTGDAQLIGAVLAVAIGYAEGGVLARKIGAWQTICWALALSLPAMLALTLRHIPAATAFTPATLISFGYLSLVSMFLAFFAWYRGLGIGPVSSISQIQLLQPTLSTLWATLVVGEHPGPAVYAGVVVVLVAATTAIRARAKPGRPANLTARSSS